MDLNQLKSLINEEIKRTRQNNLLEVEEPTAVGRKAPNVPRQDVPEPFDPGTPEEEQTFKDSIQNASPQELKAHQERLFKEMIPHLDEATLWKFLKATMGDTEVQNIISDLMFVYRKLHKTGGSPDDLSQIPDRTGGFGLPTATQVGRNPDGKTAAIDRANRPTNVTVPEVEPIGANEPTRTGKFDKFRSKLGFKEE